MKTEHNFFPQGVKQVFDLPEPPLGRDDVLRVLQEHGQRRDKKVGGKKGEFGEKREFHDNILQADEIYRRLFPLWRWYRENAQRLSNMLGCKIVVSPYVESAVTIKRYSQPGDEHGWHVETNCLTLLYYWEAGGVLEYCLPGEREPVLEADFVDGTALLVQGHDTWHRVPPLLKGERRMLMVCNYYVEGHEVRPEGLDELHYA